MLKALGIGFAECSVELAATPLLWAVQDINSRSWLVRMYYKHRLFMGACCISCEVLYLSVRSPSARSLPAPQAIQ